MTPDQQNEFRQWVYDYADMLLQHILKSGIKEDDAKDILQDSFLSAWRNMDSFRAEMSAKNWLFIIVKNKVTDYFRKVATGKVIEELHNEYEDDRYFDHEDHWAKDAYPRHWQVDYNDVVERKQFYAVFKKCSSRLKELQNHVFSLKYLEGYDSDEICTMLNITPSNYWIIVHRAKLQLRSCLQKNWIDQ